jgi:hypothetical protein
MFGIEKLEDRVRLLESQTHLHPRFDREIPIKDVLLALLNELGLEINAGVSLRKKGD